MQNNGAIQNGKLADGVQIGDTISFWSYGDVVGKLLYVSANREEIVVGGGDGVSAALSMTGYVRGLASNTIFGSHDVARYFQIENAQGELAALETESQEFSNAPTTG